MSVFLHQFSLLPGQEHLVQHSNSYLGFYIHVTGCPLNSIQLRIIGNHLLQMY